MDTFEIVVHLAGIKTKEGEEILSVAKEIETGSIPRIVFENGSMLWLKYFSKFVFNPGTSHMMMCDKWLGSGINTIDSLEYWKEFREAAKEVAAMYEY